MADIFDAAPKLENPGAKYNLPGLDPWNPAETPMLSANPTDWFEKATAGRNARDAGESGAEAQQGRDVTEIGEPMMEDFLEHL